MYPVTYHSIAQEIPLFARSHMRRMYALVLTTFVALSWNLVTELALYLIGVMNTTNLVFAAIYFGTGTFGAWKFWYRQIYYALRDRKTVKWWVFFFFFAAHCAFAALVMLAPAKFPEGAGGFWLITDAMQNNAVVGIFVLTNGVLWLLLDVASLFYLVASWRMYRTRSSHPVDNKLIQKEVEEL